MSAALTRTAQAALKYLGRGWAPLLYASRTKAPKEKGWTERRYTAEELTRADGQNVGLLTGAPSGGLTDVDLDCPEALAVASAFLPSTAAIFGRRSRPKSHRLYLCDRLLAYATFKDVDGTSLLEVRTDGHQTMAPPSVHPSGEVVEWDEEGDPALVPGAVLVRACGELAAACLLARHWPAQGSRDTTALALAGGLLRAGWESDRAGWFIGLAARTAGDEEAAKRAAAAEDTQQRVDAGKPATGWNRLRKLIDAQVVDCVVAWLRADDHSSEEAAVYLLTDGGNAERLAAEHGQDLHYCHPWRRWLVWDGTRWADDDRGAADQIAKETIRQMLQEATAEPDEEKRKRKVKFVLASDSRLHREAMVVLARSEPGIPVTPEDLDRDAWLLNVQNGTLHLRGGTLHPHRREDLMTRLAPVAYDPEAKCPRWLTFMQEVTLQRPPLAQYLQKAVGLALTGDISEQCLFFLHGAGSNGKSTFIETITGLLGPYARKGMPELLMAAQGAHRHPTEVAALRGARLVVTQEVEKGSRWMVGRLKYLTGDQEVTTRALYQDPVTFPITWKFFVIANERPKTDDNSDAFWRRIKLIPFEASFAGGRRDKTLPGKLRAELPGILNWCLEGLRAWCNEGLGAPPQVTQAVEEYRRESDTLTQFLKECCEVGEAHSARAMELFEAYRAWCQSRGLPTLSPAQFKGEMVSEGYFSKHKNTGAYWCGLSLRGKLDDSDLAGN